MDIVVTSANGVIKAGILSESLFSSEDTHNQLDEVKKWENEYINFVKEGKRKLSMVKNQTDLVQKWEIGDFIYSFLNRNDKVNFLDWDKSIARDMEVKPTEERKVGFGENDIKALVNLRKIFKTYNDLDKRISWELMYFTNQLILSYIENKKLDKLILPKNKLIDEILELANQEAKFAVKGNSGHAISVTKKIIEHILDSL